MSRISLDLDRKIRLQAKNRCGYCLSPQAITTIPLEIDHLVAQSKGGADVEDNLWLACRVCNGFKYAKSHGVDFVTGETAALFNPRAQSWPEHFTFSADKTKISGRTACGRATVIALRLNNEQAVNARKLWVLAGWYPPQD